MPVVKLSEEMDKKLKRLVTDPFDQTRESLIENLIDAELKRRAALHKGRASLQADDENVIRLNPDHPGSLAHSKVMSAQIAGRAMLRPTWNGIRERMHVLGMKRLSFQELEEASWARIRKGRFEKEGFKYVPDGDFSIQGVDSNWSWVHAQRLAYTLKVPIKITFEWRNKKGAAHPGKRGVLEWNPQDA